MIEKDADEPPSSAGSSNNQNTDDAPSKEASLFQALQNVSEKNGQPDCSPRSLLQRLQRAFGFRHATSLEEEVAELLEEHDPDGTQMSSEGRTMLSNVFQLQGLRIHDVMIPRTDIIAVEESITLRDLKKVIIEKEHTRIPVYRKTLDNVIGFIHVKDLLPLLGTKQQSFSMKDTLREIIFAPPSMRVVDLLVRMRNQRLHMALVLDEYGGTDGLVTLEDLMEEIVGEIEDEHDVQNDEVFTEMADGSWQVNARMPINELQEKLHISLVEDAEQEDFDTVGGLVFYMLGRVPEKGEIVAHPSGIEFKISEADPRRIHTLILSKIPAQSAHTHLE